MIFNRTFSDCRYKNDFFDTACDRFFNNVLNDWFVDNRKHFLSIKKILLIDDIATTGATLNECAKVLKKYGAREVWGLVLAHG